MAFDIDIQDLEHNIPQSACKMVAPNIARDDITTNVTGFSTIQNQDISEDTTHEERHQDNTKNTTDTLCMLYAKAAKKQDMNSHDYCTHIVKLKYRTMPYSDVQ